MTTKHSRLSTEWYHTKIVAAFVALKLRQNVLNTF